MAWHGRRFSTLGGGAANVWHSGQKLSLFTQDLFHDTDTNYLVLMTEYIGFRVNWIRQILHHNLFARRPRSRKRHHIHLAHMTRRTGLKRGHCTEGLSQLQLTMHLLGEEGRFGMLDLDKPLPDIDPEFGAPNGGFHTLFDAWRGVLTLKLCSDEVSLKKRWWEWPDPAAKTFQVVPPYTSPSSTRRKRPNTLTAPRASLRRLICELWRHCTSERRSMPRVDLTQKIRGA